MDFDKFAKDRRICVFPLVKNTKGSERNLYISKTHDVSLLGWYRDKIAHQIEKPLFVITIDQHIDIPDHGEWDDLIRKLEPIKQMGSIQEQLTALEENFQSLFQGHDVHFLLAGLELDLVEGCLVFSPENGKEERKEKLKEHFPEKLIAFETYLSGLFYPNGHGIMNNKFDPEVRDLKDKIKNSYLIVDIDLDYFTYVRDDRHFHICQDNFNWLFNQKEIKELFMEHADCITITLEKLYCNYGNEGNCKHILRKIIEFFRKIGLIEKEISYEDICRKFQI